MTLAEFFEVNEKSPDDENPKPFSFEIGKTYEIHGHETGKFISDGYQIFGRWELMSQHPRHAFILKFEPIAVKKTGPVVYSPGDFLAEEAIFQGKAENIGEDAYVVGNGWKIRVAMVEKWEPSMLGKTVESRGHYWADPKLGERAYRQIDGPCQPVKLADMVGREVTLRGRAVSNNDCWWFSYRGVDLYVENMDKLPGWSGDNHWKPVVIGGRLEKIKAKAPHVYDDASKEPVSEQFIIKDASWSPIGELLSPERPDDEPK